MFKLTDFNDKIQSQIRRQLADAAAPRVVLPDSQQRQCPKALAGSDEGETQSTRLPRVRFTLVRKKLLDVDAKYASVKDLLDGLAIAGIIPGDKEGQITLEVVQRRTTKGEPEQTIIEVI
jgi:hypothetical protein